MTLLQHVKYPELKLIMFHSFGPHILCSRVRPAERKCEVALVENDVFQLLRKQKAPSFSTILKYCIRNIERNLELVEAKKYVIIAPDYPFDRELNLKLFHLFYSRCRKWFELFDIAFVCHGYYAIKEIPETAHWVAIPLNTISVIHYRLFQKAYKLSTIRLKEIINYTIERILDFREFPIHLLGPVKRTLEKIFYSLTNYERELYQHVKSFDSLSYKLAAARELRKVDYGAGKYMIPTRKDKQQLQKFFEAWLRGLPFKVVDQGGE